jgi:hypoxanthine phosphoribosyltransferase
MDHETAKPQVGKILLTESALSARVAGLAAQIKAAYADVDSVVAVVLMQGAKRFADELFSLIDDGRFELRYLTVSSYRGVEQAENVSICGEVGDVAYRDVLIVDDIYDRGLTLSGVMQMVCRGRPRRVRVCCLLEKQTQHREEIKIDFKAATVPDCFVVGYGLDYAGQYRHLPFVAQLDLTGP